MLGIFLDIEAHISQKAMTGFLSSRFNRQFFVHRVQFDNAIFHLLPCLEKLIGRKSPEKAIFKDSSRYSNSNFPKTTGWILPIKVSI